MIEKVNMKTIKIKFINFWNGFDEKDNFITSILKKRYKIQITENPDYIFASVFGNPYEYMQYDCVRILFTGEPFSPDFNVFDYAIGFDDLIIRDNSVNGGVSDRYMRYPVGLLYLENSKCLQACEEERAWSLLKQKNKFCNFIYSHESWKGKREEIFHKIDEYKHVDSVGSYLNNQNDNIIITRDKKVNYLKNFKFTIACESISYPGFMTEKIIQAFEGYTIPIYYGDPNIKNDINEKAFINVADYNDYKVLIDHIREIDCDDSLFVEYLMQQKEASLGYFDRKRRELELFLFNIFSQEVDNAYRRIRDYMPLWHGENLKDYNCCYKYSKAWRTVRKLMFKTTRGIFV